MNKFKALAANTAIFGISQFTSKILVFFLLPLYTSYMSETDYGSSDLVFSTVSLLLPICTLEISSAVMRFSMERRRESASFFRFGFMVILLGFAVLLACCPVFLIFHLFEGYLYLFYLLFLCNAFYQLLSYYSRGIQRVKLVGIVGVINTIVVIGLNILFLVGLRLGIIGYLLSYIGGYLISDIVYLLMLHKNIFANAAVKKNQSEWKNMIKYSVPLVPNNVSWWLVSSANKYIISGYLSNAVLGLYSVALKIPTIINTVQGVFSEALVLSILQEYNNKEKDEEYFSTLYRLYSTFSILVASFVILFARILSDLLFAKDFYQAWVYVPLLCISPVWGALSGYLGNFYAATKKNNGMFFSTLLGGGITVLFSVLTVRFWGVYGIIAGNLISYFFIWLYRWLDTKKLVKLRIQLGTDIAAWILLIAQALIMTFLPSTFWAYCGNAVIIIILIMLKHQTIFPLIKKSVQLVKQKLGKQRN